MEFLPLANVSSRYGAPMGRIDSHDPASFDQPIRLYLSRLVWEDGDYDQGGAYWGGNRHENIFRAYSAKGVDSLIDFYVRAADYAGAEKQILGTYKQARIVRVEQPAQPTYWNSSSYGNDLEMTLADAESVSHSGEDATLAVEALLEVPYLHAQVKKLRPERLRRELHDYGCWDRDELADHSKNVVRWVWLSGNDIRENCRREN